MLKTTEGKVLPRMNSPMPPRMSNNPPKSMYETLYHYRQLCPISAFQNFDLHSGRSITGSSPGTPPAHEIDDCGCIGHEEAAEGTFRNSSQRHGRHGCQAKLMECLHRGRIAESLS